MSAGMETAPFNPPPQQQMMGMGALVHVPEPKNEEQKNIEDELEDFLKMPSQVQSSAMNEP